MNRLETLPTDISILTLLRYIPPQDFDTFCSWLPASKDSSSRNESWCSNPKNIEYYLSLHPPVCSYSTCYNDLDWAVTNGSRILTKHFLSQDTKDVHVAMARAAIAGNTDLVKLLLPHGPTDYNTVMAFGALAGSMDIVRFIEPSIMQRVAETLTL